MSLLINNDLIWLSIPRNASHSIESSFLNSNLNIKLCEGYFQHKKYTNNSLNNSEIQLTKHLHFRLERCIKEFGHKDTICIERDYASRWVSGLIQLFKELADFGVTFRTKLEDVDNEFIYNLFDENTIKSINTCQEENLIDFIQKLIKNGTENIIIEKFRFLWIVLVSQNYWKSNKPCTYQFNINELDKFKMFIKDRYDVDIIIPKLNTTIDSKFNKNKIILDDKLRNWIWDNFEKPFIRTNNLI
jgi:hypothetical protein